MPRHGIRALIAAVIASTLLALALAAASPAVADPGSASPAAAGEAAPAAIPVRTDTGDFSFDSFDADYTLTRDPAKSSALKTVETLVAEFPEADQNHGIVRAIPLTDQHTNLELSIVSVTDATGTSIPFQRDDSDGFAQLKIGSANAYVHGRQTYVITYTQRNVVRPFADTNDDEFYWDVNGTAWDQPFGRVTARLHLDGTLTSALTGAKSCYFGPSGSANACAITSAPEAGGSVITAGQDSLGPQENVTMAVAFTSGTFAPPPDARDAFPFAVLPWILLGIALAVLAATIAARLFLWRTPRGRGIIVPQYTPPPGMFPALAAQLLKRDDRAIPAQLIGFAVNKVAALIDHSDANSPDAVFGLKLLAEPESVPDPDERRILTRVFGTREPGSEVLLDPTDHALGDRMAGLGAELDGLVDSRGLRGRAKSSLPVFLRLGIVVVLAVWLLLVWWASVEDGSTDVLGWGFWAILVIAILVFALGRVPDLLTATGVEMREYLLGLRDYLALAEADRFRVLQSPQGAERVDVTDGSAVVKLNERLLPYAIVWGVEKEWMKELAHSYETTGTQPDWAAGGVNSALLPLQIAAFSTLYAGAPFEATPPTPSFAGSNGGSFSGGAGGGGFSGGGGGGGGGGGW